MDAALRALDHPSPQVAMCAACGVRQFSLCGVLDGPVMDRFLRDITDVRIEAGQRIYSAQEAGRAIHTVRSGVVRLERVSAAGERRILRLAGRTDCSGSKPCSASAMRPTPSSGCLCATRWARCWA
jgi:CRP-like cAMP-binding protein